MPRQWPLLQSRLRRLEQPDWSQTLYSCTPIQVHAQLHVSDLSEWSSADLAWHTSFCAAIHGPYPITLSAAGDAGSRQLSGLLLRELVRGAPETFAAHASAVLPCAFVACHDDDTEAAAVWKEMWEEGTGSPAAATRLHISEIAGIICTGAATICIALP